MRSKFLSKLYDGKFLYAYGQDQHQGRRPYQEDFFGFYEPDTVAEIRHKGLLFVLADGMGGTTKGDAASIMAVEGMIRNYREILQDSIPEALNSAITKTNDEIFQRGLADRRFWKMGTTCLAAVLKEGELYFISVGDSHLYLLREGRLTRLNEEHSVGVEMDRRAKAGLISEQEAIAHPGRDKLVSSLGEKAINKVDVARTPLKLAPGDKLILCSDGLYGYYDMTKSLGLVQKLPPQKAVERLIHETMEQGHENQDNISVQIIEVFGEARKADVQTYLREKTRTRKSLERKARREKARTIGIAAAGAVLFFALGLVTERYLLKGPRPEEPPAADKPKTAEIQVLPGPIKKTQGQIPAEQLVKDACDGLIAANSWEEDWRDASRTLERVRRDSSPHAQQVVAENALNAIERAIKDKLTELAQNHPQLSASLLNNWRKQIQDSDKQFQRIFNTILEEVYPPESKKPGVKDQAT